MLKQCHIIAKGNFFEAAQVHNHGNRCSRHFCRMLCHHVQFSGNILDFFKLFLSYLDWFFFAIHFQH